MPLIPFSPPPGLNSDDTTFSAEGRWADGNNVRFWNGKAQTIGSWSAFSAAMTGTTRNLYAFRGASSTHMIAGNVGKVYEINTAGSVTDITPASFGASNGALGYTFGSFGTNLVFSPAASTIYEWTGSGSATEITQAPDAIHAGILATAERQILAFACNEEISGTVNRRCIRGCDLEDATDWTTTATNNAFEHILDDPGTIIGARLVGPYVAVWTTASLFVGQFIGDPGQTYRFDRVDSGCGLASISTVCVHGQTAYWLTPNLVWMSWTPGTIPTPIPCPIWKEFAANCDSSILERAACFYNTAFSEVWLFYADKRDSATENSRYVAFSAKDGTWFRGQLARTAALDTRGILTKTDSSFPPSAVFMARLSDLKVYTHEKAAGNASFDWHIQSADWYLDNSQRRVMIRGIIPDFEDQSGSVSLTLFCRDRPQSTAVTKGPYTLTVGATKKDFRASGKIVSVKFSVTSVQIFARLGKPLFDVVPLGER